MKRLHNDNKKLQLETMGIRKLSIDEVEQAGGGTDLRVPGSPADIDSPNAVLLPGGNKELHC